MTFQTAVRLHREGRTDEAAVVYEQILRAEPSHVAALVHLGAIRVSQKRAAEAEALLRRAVAVAPCSAEALANLAAAEKELNRFKDAIVHLEQALALRPDMTDARFALSACFQAIGRYDAALEAYRLLLKAQPDNYSVALRLLHSLKHQLALWAAGVADRHVCIPFVASHELGPARPELCADPPVGGLDFWHPPPATKSSGGPRH